MDTAGIYCFSNGITASLAVAPPILKKDVVWSVSCEKQKGSIPDWKKIFSWPQFPVKREAYPTTLRFPPMAAGDNEKQVQQLNYNYFIRVMAEMVQKYAPEILK